MKPKSLPLLRWSRFRRLRMRIRSSRGARLANDGFRPRRRRAHSRNKSPFRQWAPGPPETRLTSSWPLSCSIRSRVFGPNGASPSKACRTMPSRRSYRLPPKVPQIVLSVLTEDNESAVAPYGTIPSFEDLHRDSTIPARPTSDRSSAPGSAKRTHRVQVTLAVRSTARRAPFVGVIRSISPAPV